MAKKKAKKKTTRKKVAKKKPDVSGTLLVDKEGYLAGMIALNGHLEELMMEYTRVHKHLKNPGHPILQSIVEQIRLMNDIVNCLESSIKYGDAQIERGEPQ